MTLRSARTLAIDWYDRPHTSARPRPAYSSERPETDTPTEAVTQDQSQQHRETQLSLGVQAYQRGNREQALAILSALAAEPGVKGTPLQLEAMIYLGEIHYIQGDEQNARSFFEMVILTNPRHVLDPFRHPPDVAAFFNQVKLTMDLSAVEVPPLSIRPGLQAWAPMGVYHFRHERSARGWLYASGGSHWAQPVSCWPTFCSVNTIGIRAGSPITRTTTLTCNN